MFLDDFNFSFHETIHPRKGTETERRTNQFSEHVETIHPRKGTETRVEPHSTKGWARNNSSPQGDGNCDGTVTTAVTLWKQFIPARGRKPPRTAILPTSSAKQFIPARGRKPISLLQTCALAITKQFIPARGRKPCTGWAGTSGRRNNSSPQGDGNQSVNPSYVQAHETIHPRKGTETHFAQHPRQQRIRNNSSPQGDGNS